ncbi:hypothetical protein B0A71_09935 [Flavobacterium tructae]|uniref:Uncharacterized protein n=2 Tax=Flavobacterium tructae TaxID=1114873 RepID=A0A1S1J1J1_9FLAO|nr:hypothetical protein BHE19_18920 [Flavobacterium tructae]OXB19754.1 hypothetical protein B0A71_09935 [Flavobacterium tructae]
MLAVILKILSMKQLDFIIKILPLVSLFIFLCSAIKLFVFYSFFDIQIANYLEVQEYIPLFISNAVGYLIIFSACYTLYFFQRKKINSRIEILESVKHIFSFERKTYISIFFISILLLAFYVFIEIKSNFYLYSMLIVLLYSFYSYSTYSKSLFSLFPIILVTGLISFTILDGAREALKIINDGNLLEYTFHFKNKKIQTDHNLKYLGRSKNYIFFYQRTNKKSTVLSIDDLIETDITTTNSHY